MEKEAVRRCWRGRWRRVPTKMSFLGTLEGILSPHNATKERTLMHSTSYTPAVRSPAPPRHDDSAGLASLSAWTAVVRTHLPHLAPAVVTVLALWSFGMVVAQSCGLTTVACTVAQLLGKKEAAARQQLREWC